MVDRAAQPTWLVDALAALRGALAAGDYDSANHLLAAIEAACERGGNKAAEQTLADAYLLLDRAAPTFRRLA